MTMRSITLVLGILLLVSVRTAGATPEKEVEKSWTFSFYFENDMFADTDQNYTNGTKLTWISPDLSRYRDSGKLPEWSLPYIRRLPFINEKDLIRNVAFSIGQNMFTPQDIAEKGLIEDDRPYGGWTYGGVAFQSKNDRRLDTIEIQLGMVGPASFTDRTQDLVHKLRDIQRPEGWDNQIKDEPGLAMIYERKWRIPERSIRGALGYDVITHLGGVLGNVYTYANIGAECRVGWNIPIDFGTSLIRPGGDTNAPVSARDPRIIRARGFSVHVFGAVNGRAVLRDIFLDGNTFSNSHSVEKEPFVAEAAAGVSLIVHRFKISYAQVFQTKTFRIQKDSHSFGSITLSFSY
jgi:lipid A 3-O-deacylase